MKFTPMLADSWKATPHAITINLRKDATWQDGAPVTSQDVINTFELGATIGWTVLNGVSKISAPNAHEVVFDLTKGTIPSQELQNILQQYLAPSQLYGKFVKPGLLHDVLVQSNAAPTAQLPQSVTTTIADVKTALLKYNPTTYVGNGPYKLMSMTTNQANLSLDSNFFDAKKIHVPQIVVLNAESNSTGWGYMSAGRTDFSWTGAPKNIKDKWLSDPNHHMALPWDWSQYAFYFNSKKYPLNKVQVRQALAYILNRSLLSEIGNGYVRNKPIQLITGIQVAVQSQWIPQKDFKGFNMYPLNLTKAAKLLESVGFKKVNGSWQMPNGKPFTLSLIAPAGWTGPTLDTEAAANELDQFGIKSSATAVEQPGYWTEQNKGQFEISWGWGGWWVFNPLQTFYDDLVNQNYTPHQQGYIGMGFGPSVNVPGLGKVNLADNLTAAQKITNKAEIRKLSLEYAKVVNQQLPFLPYADKRLAVWYSSANYIDWPSANSPLWNQMGGNANGGLTLMLMQGYVRPR